LTIFPSQRQQLQKASIHAVEQLPNCARRVAQ
jgi:hypothetical protein